MRTFAVLLAFCSAAHAAEQTKTYAPNGSVAVTAVPLGNGSQRYYDARGSSIGTSATASDGTTTFYDARGNVTGRTAAPRR
jgi:uncharacterized protein RhaS with RHS repeats